MNKPQTAEGPCSKTADRSPPPPKISTIAPMIIKYSFSARIPLLNDPDEAHIDTGINIKAATMMPTPTQAESSML